MSASSIKAGQAYVEIATKDGLFNRGLAAVQSSMKSFAAKVNVLGKTAGSAISKGFTGAQGALSNFSGKVFNLKNALVGSFAVVGVAKLISDFAEAGGAIDDMANRTGMAVESISALGYAAKMSGASVQDVEKASITSGKAIAAASQGNKAAIATLGKLGLTAEQLKKMTPEQQMLAFAEQISKIPDQATRASMSMKIFGKSGAALLPMFEGGADGVQSLMEEAANLGQVMSSESASSAAALGDSLDRLWGAFDAVKNVIASAVAPMITWLSDTITENVTAVNQWIQRNQGLIVVAAQVAAGVAVAGGALLAIAGTAAVVSAALGGLIAMAGAVGTAFTIMGTIIGAIMSPIGIVVAGIAALGAAVLYYSGAGGAMLGWLGSKFTELADFVMPVIEGIKTALMSGQFAAAGKILFTTLEIAFRTGTQSLYGIWVDLGTKLQNVWTDVWGFITDNFGGIINGISSIWESTVNQIAKSLLYLYSLFDRSIDYEAAAKSMDNDTVRRREEREKAGFASKDEREKLKQERRDKANENKESFANKIDELKKSLTGLLADVKEEADNQAEENYDSLSDRFANLPTLPNLDDAAKTATGEKATSVQGTFSGFAAAIAGSSVSAFDRMLDESKKTNSLLSTVSDHTAQIAENTEDMGGDVEFDS